MPFNNLLVVILVHQHRVKPPAFRYALIQLDIDIRIILAFIRLIDIPTAGCCQSANMSRTHFHRRAIFSTHLRLARPCIAQGRLKCPLTAVVLRYVGIHRR